MTGNFFPTHLITLAVLQSSNVTKPLAIKTLLVSHTSWLCLYNFEVTSFLFFFFMSNVNDLKYKGESKSF